MTTIQVIQVSSLVIDIRVIPVINRAIRPVRVMKCTMDTPKGRIANSTMRPLKINRRVDYSAIRLMNKAIVSNGNHRHYSYGSCESLEGLTAGIVKPLRLSNDISYIVHNGLVSKHRKLISIHMIQDRINTNFLRQCLNRFKGSYEPPIAQYRIINELTRKPKGFKVPRLTPIDKPKETRTSLNYGMAPIKLQAKNYKQGNSWKLRKPVITYSRLYSELPLWFRELRQSSVWIHKKLAGAVRATWIKQGILRDNTRFYVDGKNIVELVNEPSETLVKKWNSKLSSENLEILRGCSSSYEIGGFDIDNMDSLQDTLSLSHLEGYTEADKGTNINSYMFSNGLFSVSNMRQWLAVKHPSKYVGSLADYKGFSGYDGFSIKAYENHQNKAIKLRTIYCIGYVWNSKDLAYKTLDRTAIIREYKSMSLTVPKWVSRVPLTRRTRTTRKTKG